ncbi:hypothetical protein KAR91_50355 [Candidatus Pacearchaeota archaeon]|nr:hypothetical protein [Candidatus Pacearchaeota archaeon]
MVAKQFVPDWVNAIDKKLWAEDDSYTVDREMIESAWLRLFNRNLLLDPIIHEFDDEDAIYRLHAGERVSCHSCEGGRIYKLEGFIL